MMKRVCLFILLLAFVSCIKEEESPLLNLPVYLKLNLTFRDKVLNGIPSYKTYKTPHTDFIYGKEFVGFGGVLVVRTALGNFEAFDLACPFEASSATLVEVEKDMIHAVCPKCGRKYEVGVEGFGNSDEPKYFLKKYYVNQTSLIVTNPRY